MPRKHPPQEPPTIFAAAVHSCQACVIGKAVHRRCPFVRREYSARSVVCCQGEVPTTVLFVREGLVALASSDARGDEGDLALRGPRSLLCVEALLGLPAPKEIRALTDLEVCALSSARLAGWVGPESSPGRAVMSLLLSELVRRDQDTGWREGKSLTRVARYLLARESWPLTQRPLRKLTVARMLAMRPETLSRSLRTLVTRGWIEAGPDHRVRDVSALSALTSLRH